MDFIWEVTWLTHNAVWLLHVIAIWRCCVFVQFAIIFILSFFNTYLF